MKITKYITIKTAGAPKANMDKKNILFYVLLLIFSVLVPIVLDLNLAFYGMLGSFFIFLSLHFISYWLFAFVFCVVLATCAVFLPQIIWFGHPPATMIASFFETDLAESKEFMEHLPSYSYLASLSLLSFGLYILFLGKNAKTDFKNKWKVFCLCLVSAIFITLYKPVSKMIEDNAPFSLQYTRVGIISFYYSIFNTIEEYRASKEEFKKQIVQEPSWEIKQVNPQKQIYVLVVGESARKDYMSAYGFSVKNTPFLEKVNGTLVDGYTSAAPNTVSSLTRSFVKIKEDKFLYADNIITLANRAGFETVWISNQGHTGQHDAPIGKIADMCHRTIFSKKGGYHILNYKDSAILPVLKKELEKAPQKKHKLIVLHLMGSHSSFYQRLESRLHHSYFNPDISAYIQTIEQTDELLSSIYQMLKKTNKSFSLLYFSDHGLITKDRNSKIYATLTHGDNSPTQACFSVPFLIASSGDSLHRVIKTRKSAFNFLHGYATWLGIKEKSLRENYNFTDTISDTLKVFDHHKNVPFDSLEKDPVIENK